MKRFLLSSVFALLMIFPLAPEALAEEFCALGSHRTGTELNCRIAEVSAEAVVSAEGLPEGLYVVEIPGAATKELSLCGMAAQAGRVDFSITVSEAPELISCSIDLLPASPAVVKGGDVRCAVGESAELFVTASISDGGSLGYQWFASQSADPAYAIADANGPSFSPDTSSPGSYVYCCQVTNTNNGLFSSTLSQPITLTVAEPLLTGIEIQTLPEKMHYIPGDSLDPTGLSIRLNYDNGSSEIIEGGFEASPARFTELGRQNVVLQYGSFSCAYEVDVSISEADIEGIGVLSLPEKTEYKPGESLDTEGLSVRVYTANGHFDVSEGLECRPETFRDPGRQSITVSYAGKRCSFTVTVKDDNQLRSIDIASLPTRREYTVGDTLDTSGLSIQLIYGSRTEIASSGFDCSPSQFSTAGSQTVTVSYAGHSASFSINVKEAPASPTPRPGSTPAPSESPAVETLSPAESAAPKVEREHQARELGGLVKIIFFVALLSLVALGAYVFYMRKKGRR